MSRVHFKYLIFTIDVLIAIISLLIFAMEAYLVFFEPKHIYHIYELNFENSWFVMLINFLLSITAIGYLIKKKKSSLKIYFFIILGYFMGTIMDWYFLKTYPCGIYLVYILIFFLTILIHEKLDLKFYIYSILIWAIFIRLLLINKYIFLLFWRILLHQKCYSLWRFLVTTEPYVEKNEGLKC